MNVRAVRLRAIEAASKLHNYLGLKKQIRDGLHPIDVYKAISQLDVPLMFRPLEGVLGAYLSSPYKGIMISSADSVSQVRQRYTAAHELGHCFMEHETSLDSEEFLNRVAASIGSAPIYEAEAEAFASEFLMPKNLIISTAKRSGWGAKDIKDPRVVYQLSLRLGTSYTATSYALKSHNLITTEDLSVLKEVRPKEIKKQILGGELELENSHSDVVVLSERDHERSLILKPGDYVILNLPENTSSGFQWRVPEVESGLELIQDGRDLDKETNILGQPVRRRITFQGKRFVDLALLESRSWGPRNEKCFRLRADFQGREEGLPRRLRGEYCV